MTDLLSAVEAWCADVLARRRPERAVPLQLLNVRPTDAELAAHPRSLNIQAYFAGARHAAGEPPQRFPRPLTDLEAESWADGWAEHRTEASPSGLSAPVEQLHLVAKAVA